MQTITVFDTSQHHVNLRGHLHFINGLSLGFKGVLDTGASKTELSVNFLIASNILTSEKIKKMNLEHDQESQKIGKIKLSQLDICGQSLSDFEVFVSHFSPHWGIDALIGLDFFKKFRVTVDYSVGHIVTEPF